MFTGGKLEKRKKTPDEEEKKGGRFLLNIPRTEDRQHGKLGSIRKGTESRGKTHT